VKRLTPAEREIWERITRHSEYRRLGRAFQLPDTHRYYLAHSPGGRAAVLRLKDPGGLLAWTHRRWRFFAGGVPTISDVTLQVLQAIELSLDMRLPDFLKSRTWVSIELGYRFLFTTEDAPPCPGAFHLDGTGEGITHALCPAPSTWETQEIQDMAGQEAAVLKFRTNTIDAQLLADLEAWSERING
jgi:hypothetical protein